MDWNLLSIVPGIFCVVVFLVGLWFGAKLWKANNKFLALMVFIVDIGMACFRTLFLPFNLIQVFKYNRIAALKYLIRGHLGCIKSKFNCFRTIRRSRYKSFACTDIISGCVFQ